MNFTAELGRRTKKNLLALRGSVRAQANLRNATYGVGEYVVLPLTMLLAAPFLLHRLGLPQYGLWMLVTATITSSGFISTGFGDAALKYAATYRGRNDRKRLEETLHVNLMINLILGSALALLIWYGSPFAVHGVFKIEPALQRAGLTVFRIGVVILLVRSVESVFVGALRAHERYGPAVQINVLFRVAVVFCACILVSKGYGIVAIMKGTLGLATVSAGLQITAARAIMGPISLYPTIGRHALSEVFSFGCFSWLQTLAGCIFCYADRLLIGVMLGTSSVAYYSVCVQAAQPIHGLIAAGLHFLFPHLSARLSVAPATELKPLVLSILTLNVVCAILLSVPLALLSKPILHLWMGVTFAQQAWVVLSIVAMGFGLLALNVSGHYTLLALGKVKLVALLNLAGGSAMLAAMAFLTPHFGLTGAAVGRLVYGPITLLMYCQLRTMLTEGTVPLSGGVPLLAIPGPELQ